MANYKVTIEAKFTNGMDFHDVLPTKDKDTAIKMFNEYITLINTNRNKIVSAYTMLYNCTARCEINHYSL